MKEVYSIAKLPARDIAQFRARIYRHFKKSGRSLPWRQTHDPYKIMVSEVMLQQTQVDRVIPKYEAFLKEFPTVEGLAGAPLSRVVSVWQGLGYNRRAKYLHEAAQKPVAISSDHPRQNLPFKLVSRSQVAQQKSGIEKRGIRF